MGVRRLYTFSGSKRKLHLSKSPPYAHGQNNRRSAPTAVPSAARNISAAKHRVSRALRVPRLSPRGEKLASVMAASIMREVARETNACNQSTCR